MSEQWKRTKCACAECVKCCKRQPGPLAPRDFEKIAEHLGESREEAKRHFWASPGCVMKNLATGETARVGTITPRYERGRCVFLNADDRCSIHEVAPFGCAFFDTHMSAERAMERSVWLAQQQQSCADYKQLRNELPYARHHKPLRY